MKKNNPINFRWQEVNILGEMNGYQKFLLKLFGVNYIKSYIIKEDLPPMLYFDKKGVRVSK
jgi:hypothetical protein